MKNIIWNNNTLYGKPSAGVCEVSSAYETGRYFLDRETNRQIFVGNSAAPDVVEDYIGFLTALGTVDEFKRGYARREGKEARLPVKKKKKK